MEREQERKNPSSDPLGELSVPELDFGEYEEFDISKFDFTIADPGDPDAAPVTPKPVAAPVTPKPEPKPEPGKREAAPIPARADRPAEAARKPKTAHAAISLPDAKTLRRKGRRYLQYALHPTSLSENIAEVLWPLFLTGCCLFLGGFYLLVGTDRVSADLADASAVPSFFLTGLLVGGTASLIFAGGCSLLMRLYRIPRVPPLRILSSVAGAAVLPSSALILGALIGLFGAAVSLSFGLIALLWWIYLLAEVLRNLLANRFAPVLAWTVLWGLGLFALMTLTFSVI